MVSWGISFFPISPCLLLLEPLKKEPRSACAVCGATSGATRWLLEGLRWQHPWLDRRDEPVMAQYTVVQESRGLGLHLLRQLEKRPSSIEPNSVVSREAPPNTTVSLNSQRLREKPASPRGEALFRCARPSGVPRGPATLAP